MLTVQSLRRSAVVLGGVGFIAFGGAFTAMPGHYRGHAGSQAVDFQFDGKHITNAALDGHKFSASGWKSPTYTDNTFSIGNADGGFFIGVWQNPTHVTGDFRPLSRANHVKWSASRIPQPKPGKYNGTTSAGGAVGFVLHTNGSVTDFSGGGAVKVSEHLRGHGFTYIGQNSGRNTTVTANWPSDRHVQGHIRRTGADELTWDATYSGH